MQFNHVANRIDAVHFDLVVEMLESKLGFVELRRSTNCICMRQPGTNVDLQFTRSQNKTREDDKIESQISFLFETPEDDLNVLATWVKARGLAATVKGYSDKEFYLDVPDAFVDFVIEAMVPEMADYGPAFSGSRHSPG